MFRKPCTYTARSCASAMTQGQLCSSIKTASARIDRQRTLGQQQWPGMHGNDRMSCTSVAPAQEPWCDAMGEVLSANERVVTSQR
jgi:hypothetical protein